MFDSYDRIFAERADRYHGAMRTSPAARRAEFEMLVAPLNIEYGAVVCDVPAGGGYLRAHLPEHVRYIAVEPSEHFFGACPEDTQAQRLRAPIEAVPLPDASVDYVLSLAGLHHCPDLATVFREMRRLLRMSGTLVIADVAQGTPPALFLNGFVDAHSNMGHRGVFFGDDLVEQLAQAGFAVVDDRLSDCSWTFTDEREAAQFCLNLFGIDQASTTQVTEAAKDILGQHRYGRSTVVPWILRRVICRPHDGLR